MDLRQMIDFHLEKDAAVTVAARPVPVEQASAFGVIVTDSEKRIIGFQEKPKKPKPMSDDPSRAYVSMGNYIFNKDTILEAMAKAQRKKQHDFGAHVIPSLVNTGKVFAYDFDTNVVPGTLDYEEKGYWRDVGSISAFFDAHMDMLGVKPAFELNNQSWPIHPSSYEGPATKILRGDIKNSVISESTVIHKAKIRNSVIRSGVIIEDGVTIENCLIMDRVVLKKGCSLKRSIVDKLNVIDENVCIGHEAEKDRFYCHVDSSGIAIVPRGGRQKSSKK
jgi:glucose-1-phosphate adenylyltransferase